MSTTLEEKGKILKWMAIAGLALAVFGAAILAIGYKEPSAGRLFTIGSLIIVSVVCLFLSTRLKTDQGAGQKKYDVHASVDAADSAAADAAADAPSAGKEKKSEDGQDR